MSAADAQSDGAATSLRNEGTVADIQRPSHHAMVTLLSVSQDLRHLDATCMQLAERSRNMLSAQCSAALKQRQAVAIGKRRENTVNLLFFISH